MFAYLWPFSNTLLEDETFVLDHCDIVLLLLGFRMKLKVESEDLIDGTQYTQEGYEEDDVEVGKLN